MQDLFLHDERAENNSLNVKDKVLKPSLSLLHHTMVNTINLGKQYI